MAVAANSRNIILDATAFTQPAVCRQLIADGRQFLANGIMQSGRRRFVEHGNQLINSYSSPVVDTFRLKFHKPAEYLPSVNAWVGAVAEKNVGELDLDFSDEENVDIAYAYVSYADLMPVVYQLQDSLHTLKLSGCKIDASKFGALGALRVLSISRVKLNEKSLKRVIKSCRALEDLSLIKLSPFEFLDIAVDRNSLRRLTIEECPSPSDDARVLQIKAPNLRYFKYVGEVKVFDIEVPLIEEVVLDFCVQEPSFNGHEGTEIGELLTHLNNAREVTLCDYTVQVIANDQDTMRLAASSPMAKLLVLREIAVHANELPGLALLLKSYRELESLIIKIGDLKLIQNYQYPHDIALDGAAFWATQRGPCLSPDLKTVSIEGFKGTENEMALLQFILNKARALEHVIVEVAKEPADTVENRRVATTHVLSGAPRVSSNVNIEVR